MGAIIKNKTIVTDDWAVLRLEADQAPADVTVAPGKIIVPLS